MKISNVCFFKNTRYFNNFNKCNAAKPYGVQISFGSDRLTIDYYDKIGSKQRQDVDFEQTIRQKENFLRNITSPSKDKKDISILDAGCGTGRDVKYFIAKGYDTDAFDASFEMCKRASEYTGINVSCDEFLTFSSDKKYDGIYARNSLLHVPKNEFVKSVENMAKSLKPGGILWASVKAGNKEDRDAKGRFYSYYHIDEMQKLISNIAGVSLVDIKQYNNEAIQNDSPIIEFIVKKSA